MLSVDGIEVMVASKKIDRDKCFNVRKDVFYIGQNIPFEIDFDGKDEVCTHLLALFEGDAVGTLRLRYYEDNTLKLERMSVLEEFREGGIGSALIKKAIDYAKENEYDKIVLNSQLHARNLYLKSGFKESGDVFLEAGIEHIYMELSL